MTALNMRVLLVTNIFPPQIGGPATFIDKLAGSLAERDWRVTVACCSDRQHYPDDRDRPFRVMRITGPNILAQQLRIPAMLAREVLTHARILVNGLEYQAYLAAKVTRRRYVLKIVGDSAWERARNLGITTASLDDFQSRVTEFPAVRGIVKRRLAALNGARLIVTPSDYLRTIVIGWGVPEQRVITIKNGVSTADLADLRPTARAGTLKVTFCGRLTNWKGVETLLLALQGLQGVTATIVGDGPELPLLTALARQLQLGDAAIFAGRQNNDVARQLVAESDVLVLMSQYEGLSHTLLEAASAGVPCIASAEGGNREAVRDGETGRLLPYGDVDTLRSALVHLRDDLELRSRMSRLAREHARTFAFADTASQYAECLSNLEP